MYIHIHLYIHVWFQHSIPIDQSPQTTQQLLSPSHWHPHRNTKRLRSHTTEPVACMLLSAAHVEKHSFPTTDRQIDGYCKFLSHWDPQPSPWFQSVSHGHLWRLDACGSTPFSNSGKSSFLSPSEDPLDPHRSPSVNDAHHMGLVWK